MAAGAPYGAACCMGAPTAGTPYGKAGGTPPTALGGYLLAAIIKMAFTLGMSSGALAIFTAVSSTAAVALLDSKDASISQLELSKRLTRRFPLSHSCCSRKAAAGATKRAWGDNE